MANQVNHNLNNNSGNNHDGNDHSENHPKGKEQSGNGWNNSMMCDLETGICGEAGSGTLELIDLNPPAKKVTLYYTTDPICSHCWALEPVLHRFVEQYGAHLEIKTVMGGLLSGWDGFADVKNGIGKPADVAGHWREVGEHSRMPIDGSLWIDNPLHSSYPPSRVFKVIQQKDEQAALTFLRRAREAVFAFNQNIADPDVLAAIVSKMGLDGEAVASEAEQPQAQQLLEQDFALARSLGVRGFPTIIMVNEDNKGVKVVGARSLDTYVQALSQMIHGADSAAGPAAAVQTVQSAQSGVLTPHMASAAALDVRPVAPLASMLKREKLLFAKEIETLYDWTPEEAWENARQQLAEGSYTKHEVLGEWYIQTV